MNLKKYIPTYFFKNIYEIDYNFLKENNIETLLFDLDNTILNYNQHELNNEQKRFFNKLLIDFDVFIITNGSKKRLEKTIDGFINGQASCKKPFLRKIKKIMTENGFIKEKTCNIGDQLISDISLGNKMGFKYTILVKPIDKKTEKFPTKFNRFRESLIKNTIKSKYIDIYEKLLKEH